MSKEWSKEWFDKYHSSEVTEDFEKWWAGYYGSPECYSEEEDEQNEYWIRKTFAWKGWQASKKENES